MCRYSAVCDMAGPDGESVYKCSRTTVDGAEYCVLHDGSYLDKGGDASMPLAALMEEVDHSRRLVGFYLPAFSLTGREFSAPLYFEQCIFQGTVDFSHANLNAELTFNSCRFAAGAKFTRAKFKDPLFFKAVTSDPGARFDFTESVLPDIRLLGSVLARATFDFAEFSRATFVGNKFTDAVSLSHAKLTCCTFMNTEFEKKVKFTAAKFSGCVFQNLQFHAGATFKSSIFDSDEKSVMDTDMSEVSFLDSDISGVKFRDHVRWDAEHHHKIYDARMFYSNPTPDGFAGTLGVLRSLRDNYEYHLMYRDAGQFFAQEMELKRMYFLHKGTLLPHPICHRIFSLTGLYYWTCGYGESLKRVGLWMALLFGASLAYFAWQAEPLLESAPHAPLGALEKFGMGLKRTLAAFFPLGGGDLPDYVVRATSVPLLGTMFIVVRRRLERKLRH